MPKYQYELPPGVKPLPPNPGTSVVRCLPIPKERLKFIASFFLSKFGECEQIILGGSYARGTNRAGEQPRFDNDCDLLCIWPNPDLLDLAPRPQPADNNTDQEWQKARRRMLINVAFGPALTAIPELMWLDTLVLTPEEVEEYRGEPSRLGTELADYAAFGVPIIRAGDVTEEWQAHEWPLFRLEVCSALATDRDGDRSAIEAASKAVTELRNLSAALGTDLGTLLAVSRIVPGYKLR